MLRKIVEWVLSLMPQKKRRKRADVTEGSNTSNESGKGTTLKQAKRPLLLVLDRVWYTQGCTIGELRIEGRFICYILEDEDRLAKGQVKKYGETAIPKGTYKIRLTKSKKFGRVLPLLISVPGFSGIRIHAGNTARDTEGCLLPGMQRDEHSVRQSKRAFRKLYAELELAKQAARSIKIEIS